MGNLQLITTVAGLAYGPAPVVVVAVLVQPQGRVVQAALPPAPRLAPPAVPVVVAAVVGRVVRPRALGLVPVAAPLAAEEVVLLRA